MGITLLSVRMVKARRTPRAGHSRPPPKAKIVKKTAPRKSNWPESSPMYRNLIKKNIYTYIKHFIYEK
jgi:hypothetical protein